MVYDSYLPEQMGRTMSLVFTFLTVHGRRGVSSAASARLLLPLVVSALATFVHCHRSE